MTENRYKVILVIFGILASFQFVQAGELERRVFSVALNKGDSSLARSSIFIEFPVKEYNLTAEVFLRKKSGLSPVEKTFQTYIKNKPEGDKIVDVHLALHLGDIVVYYFTKEDSKGKAILGATSYKKIGEGRYQKIQGALPYHASFTLINALRTLKEPEKYPPLPRDILKSLGPDRIQYVMPFKDGGDPNPESIPKEQRIIMHLKVQPFNFNIFDKNISPKIFKENPVLAFYREYLRTLSSGIKEDAYRYYWEPDTLKSMKQHIESLTAEVFTYYGKNEAKNNSEIRFLIDADPYYLIIYENRKGLMLVKEGWGLARIFKTPNNGYKMYDVNLWSDDLTHFLFKTDFKTQVLKPLIKNHMLTSQKRSTKN